MPPSAGSPPEPGDVTVRYFAAARAAAGVASETVPAATLDELVATLAERRGQQLDTVLRAASFLVDGVGCRDRMRVLPAGAVVDVLPPFAGG